MIRLFHLFGGKPPRLISLCDKNGVKRVSIGDFTPSQSDDVSDFTIFSHSGDPVLTVKNGELTLNGSIRFDG